jgi:hypothetical protein
MSMPRASRSPRLRCGRCARAGQLRAALLHYEPVPAAAWSGLYAVHARCEQAGIVQAPTHAYPKELLHTTPLLELATALLVAIAAPERLPPEEIDAAFRIARRFAGAGRLECAPFEGATHLLDLAPSAPPGPLAAAAPAAEPRWFGAQEAVGKPRRMLAQHESAMLDEDERLAREYSPGQKITVLRHFMSYWGPNPPHAERNLIRLEGGLVVVHGFHAVCHYVPHVATLAAQQRSAAKRLDVLEEEELEAPESWPERDAGLHVVHAQAEPGAGAWAEVGSLAAIRIHDRKDWWLAAIRRLELAPGGALQAEFEVLSRKPLSAWLRVLGRRDRMAANWQSASGSFSFEYLQCVVVTDRTSPGGAPLLVLPKGRYVPEQILELLHGERSRLVKLTEFVEQGKDFDCCAMEWRASAR